MFSSNVFCSCYGFPGCYKGNSSKTNWDVPEFFFIFKPLLPPRTQQLDDVHAPFVFYILLICFNDIDCIDYYHFQKKKLEKKMLPSTLDMVPSPSTWNPRPSTLDKKIDSIKTRVTCIRNHRSKPTHSLTFLSVC